MRWNRDSPAVLQCSTSENAGRLRDYGNIGGSSMTSFHTAGDRTEYLPSASDKWSVALDTYPSGSAADRGMVFANSARSAMGRTASRPCTAFRTSLWVFTWAGELPPMFILVAWYTKCNAIADVYNQFRAFCDWLNMMGVDGATRFAAPLASEKVAGEYDFAPPLEFATGLPFYRPRGIPAFPSTGVFAYKERARALAGAEDGAVVCGVILFIASLTGSHIRLAPTTPA